MMQKLKNEPVIIALLARLALYAGAKFGLQITVDDLLNVLIAVEAIAAAWTRTQVTPNAKVEEKVRASVAPEPKP